MTPPLRILMLGDGKPGHENQALGLIDGIGKLTPITVERQTLKRRTLVAHPPEHTPDLIVGAGHAVHAPMLLLSRKTAAPCIVLMKPSLPLAFFDLCLMPEHDLKGDKVAPNVIPTKGALNRVPPPDDKPRRGGLILLGGPSSNHGWDSIEMRNAVTTIVESCASRPWRITDSRRTPSGDLDDIVKACPAIVSFPHETTGPEWLPQRLGEASEVWVTGDSVSMIYESLSSGAGVGLLPVPQKAGETRVSRGVDKLVADGYLTHFSDWDPGSDLDPPRSILRESDRIAQIVLNRYFPDRTSEA